MQKKKKGNRDCNKKNERTEDENRVLKVKGF